MYEEVYEGDRFAPITEGEIQRMLWISSIERGHDLGLCIPNVYGANGAWNESDMLSCSKSGYLTEYEIKISRSDFLADFNKKSKHNRYSRGFTGQVAYFTYVTAGFPVSVFDIPSYAGLLRVVYILSAKKHALRMVKKAPRFTNARKVSDAFRRKVAVGLAYRYWEGKDNE